MNKIIPFLKAIKVLDEDGTLSHTSLLLSVAIIRLAFFPADAYTLGILTLALTHANLKRLNAHKRKQHEDSLKSKTVADQDRLQKLEEQMRSLNNSQALRR